MTVIEKSIGNTQIRIKWYEGSDEHDEAMRKAVDSFVKELSAIVKKEAKGDGSV